MTHPADTGLTVRPRRRTPPILPFAALAAALTIAAYLSAGEISRATICAAAPIRAVFGPPIPPPEPVTCPTDTTAPVGFVGRFVDRLHAAATPSELRAILARVYAESRWQPDAVSDRGAVGLCGIRLSAWPDIDAARLTTDPGYQADQCLRIYRLYVSQCGTDWTCCYLHGRAGCARQRRSK